MLYTLEYDHGAPQCGVEVLTDLTWDEVESQIDDWSADWPDDEMDVFYSHVTIIDQS